MNSISSKILWVVFGYCSLESDDLSEGAVGELVIVAVAMRAYFLAVPFNRVGLGKSGLTSS